MWWKIAPALFATLILAGCASGSYRGYRYYDDGYYGRPYSYNDSYYGRRYSDYPSDYRRDYRDYRDYDDRYDDRRRW
jgi:hypothetical protein